MKEAGVSKAYDSLLFGLGLGCKGNWDSKGGVVVGVERGGSYNFCCIGNAEGVDLKNFLSNFGSKNMVEMEGIEKEERETIGSMVRKDELEEVRNISMEIIVCYIHYSMD